MVSSLKLSSCAVGDAATLVAGIEAPAADNVCTLSSVSTFRLSAAPALHVVICRTTQISRLNSARQSHQAEYYDPHQKCTIETLCDLR